MVIPGCVHSHEIPEKTHPLSVSQACQAKLGMTRRVRDGSTTLDDDHAQSLKVARQVGASLFVIRIDHLIYNDYACNPLLNDSVIDIDDEPRINSAARDSDLSNSPDCFTHAMVNVRRCEIPRNVLQVGTTVASCELDPDNDRSLRKHIGQNSRITKSILEAKNYHALQSRLYDGMHRFFSSKTS